MKNLKMMTSFSLFILMLGVGVFLYLRSNNSVMSNTSISDRPLSTIHPLDTMNQSSTASWASSANSVDQVTKEADLIVRVRVIKSPEPRTISEKLPLVQVIDGKEVTVGETEIKTVFSDTTFEVIETYAGKSETKISVVQTGGPNPQNAKNITQMTDDPLYQLDEEYILFLVDISGDAVQAPDRTLYRIVNPAGRYKIENGAVKSYSERTSDSTARIPTTLPDLIAEILSSTK